MTKSAEPNLIMQNHQTQPLLKQCEGSVRAFDVFELSDRVQQILSLGLKHTVRDKIDETHYIDIFLSDLKKRQLQKYRSKFVEHEKIRTGKT